jgi:hypothetical protein
MTGKRMTLLAILAFVTLTLGSFLWFVVTWDPSKEDSVTDLRNTTFEGDRTV